MPMPDPELPRALTSICFSSSSYFLLSALHHCSPDCLQQSPTSSPKLHNTSNRGTGNSNSRSHHYVENLLKAPQYSENTPIPHHTYTPPLCLQPQWLLFPCLLCPTPIHPTEPHQSSVVFEALNNWPTVPHAG